MSTCAWIGPFILFNFILRSFQLLEDLVDRKGIFHRDLPEQAVEGKEDQYQEIHHASIRDVKSIVLFFGSLRVVGLVPIDASAVATFSLLKQLRSLIIDQLALKKFSDITSSMIQKVHGRAIELVLRDQSTIARFR